MKRALGDKEKEGPAGSVSGGRGLGWGDKGKKGL